MKLNNHGWGYKDMIIYSCLIIVVILVASYNINYLYSGLTSDSTNSDNTTVEHNTEPVTQNTPQIQFIDYNYYNQIEYKIRIATLSYLSDYNYELTGQILKTTLDSLIDLGYMDKVYDQTGGSMCTGYSNSYVDASTGEYIIKPYINCNNYRTEGY
jgi:hypothetical protein